ncbi:OLC1v1024267C1, partial [Oldenlandia corymbosa var. corymbosa]
AVYESYWNLLGFTNKSIAFVRDGHDLMLMQLATMNNQVIGFTGKSWESFYLKYRMRPGHHIVLHYDGTLFLTTVFDRNGYILTSTGRETSETESKFY